ncbi:MAG: hypothetical protein E7379_00975 [Clostridiales bacterium]|nr:hypothetical protein [Clostridiales bacterium]
MKNIQENLNHCVKLYSMDYQNKESIKTLYQVLVKANDSFSNSVIIEALKEMPESAYQALMKFMKENAFVEDYWLFEIYRNAPTIQDDYIVVESFSEEDLSFIK